MLDLVLLEDITIILARIIKKVKERENELYKIK